MFGASETQSVFGTAVKASPFSLAGNRAAFGGMRGAAGKPLGGMDDDDEDEEGESKVTRESSVFSSGQQSLELREDSITYDQVRSLSLSLSLARKFSFSNYYNF